jgi:hypothetical protein
MDAAKKRRDVYAAKAAKAKDKQGREQLKQLARDVMELATAAAKRLQISVDNAADSYSRAMKKAVEEATAKAEAAKAEKPVKQEKPAKKAAKKDARKPAKKKASA